MQTSSGLNQEIRFDVLDHFPFNQISIMALNLSVFFHVVLKMTADKNKLCIVELYIFLIL